MSVLFAAPFLVFRVVPVKIFIKGMKKWKIWLLRSRRETKEGINVYLPRSKGRVRKKKIRKLGYLKFWLWKNERSGDLTRKKRSFEKCCCGCYRHRVEILCPGASDLHCGECDLVQR